ncbi:CPBP family intramembrane glutamic endopeptidase [Nostocoides sp.]|uniref:CPBP family intramembrane glutamic endopeptidase n=1 Tax=Nostocoides sp. TaxID=1917966 RepID=UPI002C4280F3|nr:CPBP family intramembrane metalloprotease [Tetrasphaera sp.]
MINPATEFAGFLRASLIEPVPRDHTESDAAFRRRRRVAIITLAAGALVLGWALRLDPGDPLFYVGTFASAGVWTVGAFASGRLHLGRAHTRSGADPSHAIVQSLVLGGLLLALFLAGALVVARVPALRDPVDRLLSHAAVGSLPLVAVITAVNGISEELYFRGALYAGIGRRHAVAITTAIYALVTAAAGIPLLVLAAALLGIVTGLQRRVTGGILGPIVTHLTWSLGMLFLLPHVLEFAS